MDDINWYCVALVNPLDEVPLPRRLGDISFFPHRFAQMDLQLPE